MTGAIGGGGAHARGGLLGWRALTPARLRARLSAGELYFRYVALGGSAPSVLLSRHCATGGDLALAEHDLVVLALNERFMELHARERLPYEHEGTAT